MASEFTCELCGQVCPTEAEMRTHRLIVHVEGEVSCMFCDLCGISPDEMTYHINTAHSDELVNSLPVSGLVDQHAGKHYDAVSKVDKPLDAETNHLSDTLLDTGHGHQNKCNRRRTLLYDRTKCSLDVHRNDETAEEGNARKRQRHASDSQKSLGDGEEQLNELSQCPLCGLLSESAAVLQVHVAEDHNDLETKPVQDEKNFERRSLCCPVCSLRCDSRFHLELHVAQHFQESSSSASTTSVAAATSQDKQLCGRSASERSSGCQGKQNASVSSTNTDRRESARSSRNTTGCGSSNNSSTPAEDLEDFSDCTRGIIDVLRTASVGQGNITARHLCSSADHFQSNGWNCGYRNLQILLSCLLRFPSYSQRICNGKMPSVLKLQKLIEAAWSKGFDQMGCGQLEGQVVKTRKWIGATEIVAVLSYLRIKCELYDFHAPSGPNNTHPALLNFVLDYFKNASKDFVPPLYFQHQGHSRTIVGVEETASGSPVLILFDPGCWTMGQFQNAKPHELNRKMNMLRRPLHAITAKQFQIVKVVGILQDHELERCKTLVSIRIP